MFSYMLHTANTLTYLNIPLIKKKLFEVSKMCFSMDFLNTKIIFLHSEFYNMFVKLQRVLVNIPKNTKSYFWGILLYSPFIFG